MKIRDLIKLLEDDGWEQVRMKGSRRQFHHPSKPGTVTVAGKPGVEVPPGTLKEPLINSWHTCLASEITQLCVTNLDNSPRYWRRFVPCVSAISNKIQAHHELIRGS